MSNQVSKRPVFNMKKVQSSQIAEYGHDPATNTLAIHFPSKNGPGSVYHYKNFSAEDFAKFEAADSKGSHFIKHIKPHVDKHPFEKMPTEKDGA